MINKPFNDMLREVFKAGFRAGSADTTGEVGRLLLDLEKAVRADRIGCIAVDSDYDKDGHWKSDRYILTSTVLERLDMLRSKAKC